MTFVGNSPVEYENIRWIKPIPSQELGKLLKKDDIYIIASKNDPCSNALIEGLSCGLPAVALNDGGHLELIQEKKGELFNGKGDMISKIEKVAENYGYYQSQIPTFSVKKVTQDYCKFAQRICDDIQLGQYQPKHVNFLIKIKFYKMKFMIMKWKISNKLNAIRVRIEECQYRW